MRLAAPLLPELLFDPLHGRREEAVSDPPAGHHRARSASAAVAAARAAGLEVVVLSGDRREVADALGQELGVGDVRAEVTPAGKLAALEALQAEGAVVAMVGDGLNDAPALAQADVGIAMGGGTDVAKQTASVTLVRADPLAAVDAVLLGRRTLQIVRQNLAWAFGYNVALLPIAAGILAPFAWAPDFLRQLHPILAAGAMAFSSISVVTNALRLRGTKI